MKLKAGLDMGKIEVKEKKKTLLPLGLILLLGGFAINTTFMVVGIHVYRDSIHLTPAGRWSGQHFGYFLR